MIMENNQLSKLHHLIVYVLDSIDRGVGSVELVKIIYLIDVAYYRLFGKTLSGLEYIRYKLGPYTGDIAQVASELEAMGILGITITPSSGFSSIPKKTHNLKRGKLTPELSKEDKVVIENALKEISNLTPKQLENKAYKTEPMQEILKDEKKLGKDLYRKPLNFSRIQRDQFMKNWLENREKFKKEEILEYDEFLLKEKREFAALIRI